MVGAAVVVPLVFSTTSNDSFRLPKLLVLRAAAILVLAVLLAFLQRQEWSQLVPTLARPEVRIAFLVAGWAAFTQVLAARPAQARGATISIACAAVLFIATRCFAASWRPRLLDWLMIPAVLNAGLYLLQELRVWTPFRLPSALGHTGNGALLGNPNDVGVYLVPVTLAAGALAAAATGAARRRVYLPIAVLLAATACASQTLTAMVALAAGLVTLMLVAFRRRAALGIGLLCLMLAAGALWLAPMRHRLDEAVRRARTGDLNLVLSGRMPSFLAAWEMFRRNPMTGVGPGAFAGEYFAYRLRSDARYPRLAHWSPELGAPLNFGEVHSDQLQVLAEQGVIGYALLLGGLVILARRSLARRHESESEAERFARYLAAPLAVAAWTLALAQFPFQLAAFTVTFVVLAAVCLAWGPEAAVE